MTELRPYQQDVLRRTRDAMRAGTRRILIQSPTGSGKTLLIAALLKGLAAKGNRGWFINHRREILRQSVTTITESFGVSVGVVQAGLPLAPHEPIQVCAIQSLVRRLDALPTPQLLVWDECHHVASASWAALADRFPTIHHIGLTATPQRLDGKGLAPWFDQIIDGPSVATLIAQGYLAPYRLVAPPSAVTLSDRVHTTAGDFNRADLDAELSRSTVVGDALHEYQTRCPQARALLFLWSVEASQQTVKRFTAAGIPAAHVDGTIHESARDSIMARFRQGEIRVLSNVDLVSEGFDVPDLESVFLLRPTQSLGLYLQQVGRALRPAPGKTALIVDHVNNYQRHGLPDDPRQWTLDGRVGKGRQDVRVKTCPTCFGVLNAWTSVCPFCQHRFTVDQPRDVAQVAGTLTEVDIAALRRARAFEESRCDSLEALQALARQRGYKPAWAWFRWQARLGKHRKHSHV